MKRKFTKVFLLFMSISISQIMAQSGQIIGVSNTQGDLYQEEADLGVGSSADPEARVHIFNGLSTMPGYQMILSTERRSFLVTGQVNPNLPPNQNARNRDYVVTIDKFGQFGVDVLNPFTKMQLHNGIFTISAGDIDNNPMRWEIHGTSDAFAIKEQNVNEYRLWIAKESGYVGIGTVQPEEKLHVNGNSRVDGNTEINGNEVVNGDIEVNGNETINGFLMIKGNNTSSIGGNEILLGSDGYIRAREIKVDLQAIPDYVFNKEYKLMSLEDLKVFIETNKHLPNVKSEAEFNAEGTISLTEMNLKLLEKVEELTLYILDLQAQIDELKIK